MNIYINILIEFLLISLSILTLFRFRKNLGLAPLYILLGAVQYIQALSTSMISLVIFEKITLYPGSVILFSAVLFAVLLIYIKEGAVSARTLIFGIIFSNFMLSLLFGITYQQELIVGKHDSLDKLSVFFINYKYFIVGTIILLVDFFLLAIIYQYLISKIKKVPFFLVIFLSLFTVLIFDAFVFTITLKLNAPDFLNSLKGHIIGKSIAAFIFSIILYFYLRYFENKSESKGIISDINGDIFSILTHRKKYHDLQIEKKKIEKKLTSQLESTLDSISDGFVSLDKNWCYTYVNKKAANLLGRTPESLIGKHIWTEFPEGVGLPFYKAYYNAVETQKTVYFVDYYEPFDKWYENRIYPTPEGLTIYFTDISEQKKTNEYNQTLLSLIETSDDFIGIASLEGKPLYLNSNGKKLVSLEKDEEFPETITNFYPSDYHDTLENEIIPQMKRYGKWNGEIMLKNFKTGEFIPIEMAGFLINSLNTNQPIALGVVAKDITNRKRIEEELQQVQQKMEAAIRIGKIGYWSWDIIKDEVFWSDLMYEIYDVKKGPSLKYDSVLNCIHPEDRDFHNQLVEQRIKDKSNLPFEYRVLCKDKSIKYVMVQMEVIDNDKGEAIKFQGTVIDITRLKKAEIALQESENHLRTILETEPECIKQLNVKGELIYMNPAGLAMIEADNLDMVKGQLVNNLVLPEHQKAFKELKDKVFKGESGHLEFEIKSIKGTKRWLETHAVPLRDSEGKITSLLAVTRDVTERKKAETALIKSEQYLDNIINNIGDPVFVKDEESKLLLVNNAFCKIFNITKADAIGKTLAEHVPEEERESFLSIDRQVMNTGKENVNEETLTLQGKESLIISTKKSRFIDEEGNKFLIGIIRDITERKKTEKELEEYKNNLEELVKLRTEEVNLKNEELQRMNKLFVGRELRMKELKNEIQKLEKTHNPSKKS